MLLMVVMLSVVFLMLCWMTYELVMLQSTKGRIVGRTVKSTYAASSKASCSTIPTAAVWLTRIFDWGQSNVDFFFLTVGRSICHQE